MIPKVKRKSKTKSRKKQFTIFGRFESPTHGSQIETWRGEARTMATAMRRAIPIMWKRAAIRWKHYAHVHISCYTDRKAVPHG